MIKLFCIATFAAVIGAGGTALADDLADRPARPVSAAGVDFRSHAETQAFYARLREAADGVCDTYKARGRVSQEDRACASVALARAVRAADRPVLTAIHQGRRGGDHQRLAARP